MVSRYFNGLFYSHVSMIAYRHCRGNEKGGGLCPLLPVAG
jgi:hypothetical protein